MYRSCPAAPLRIRQQIAVKLLLQKIPEKNNIPHYSNPLVPGGFFYYATIPTLSLLYSISSAFGGSDAYFYRKGIGFILLFISEIIDTFSL